jgi:nicotinamide mononucleotide adenylyltransferase
MDHAFLTVQEDNSVAKLIGNARHAQLDAPHAMVEQMLHAKHVQQTTFNMVYNVFQPAHLGHIQVLANA